MVLSGCGCVLRLRPSRFPFFLVFSTSPLRVALPSPPLPSFYVVSPPLCYVASLPSFRLRWDAPLLLLTFLLCASFALCAPPSAYLQFPPSSVLCLDAPLCWLIFLNFPHISRLPRANMRPRPVRLPSPVPPADLRFPHTCPFSVICAPVSSCPCFCPSQLTSPCSDSAPLPLLFRPPYIVPLY